MPPRLRFRTALWEAMHAALIGFGLFLPMQSMAQRQQLSELTRRVEQIEGQGLDRRLVRIETILEGMGTTQNYQSYGLGALIIGGAVNVLRKRKVEMRVG